MVTRKEVSNILRAHGLNNKFTLRTIGFSDLARCDVQQVTIMKSIMCPMNYETFQSVKRELASVYCICQMEGEVYLG